MTTDRGRGNLISAGICFDPPDPRFSSRSRSGQQPHHVGHPEFVEPTTQTVGFAALHPPYATGADAGGVVVIGRLLDAGGRPAHRQAEPDLPGYFDIHSSRLRPGTRALVGARGVLSWLRMWPAPMK